MGFDPMTKYVRYLNRDAEISHVTPESTAGDAGPAREQPVRRVQGPIWESSSSTTSLTSSTAPSSPESSRVSSNMAERKVLSKYYPPDFDPTAIEKKKRSRKDGKPEAKLATIRLMTPFSMKCNHCGEFIPKGRKFNARKELLDETYLSILLHRFYIRCSRCSGEITFRTDPKNTDYELERGAKRNFEIWRNETDEKYNDETEEQTLDRLEKEHGAKEEQIQRDKMAELEDKMLDSKREMQIADSLDEIRTRNARIERTEARGDDAAMATVQQEIDEEALRRAKAEEEDREAIRQEFFAKKRAAEQAAKNAAFERAEKEGKAHAAAFRQSLLEKRRRNQEIRRARIAKGLIKPKAKATPSANATTNATASAIATPGANATTGAIATTSAIATPSANAGPSEE
ncbi:hypothetical protein N7465_008986 [Penicillium sp. CMV-2018d]|nr:hypothetical protein N7465_008986 [Penicillium sp. CMV-2018d]